MSTILKIAVFFWTRLKKLSDFICLKISSLDDTSNKPRKIFTPYLTGRDSYNDDHISRTSRVFTHHPHY